MWLLYVVVLLLTTCCIFRLIFLGHFYAYQLRCGCIVCINVIVSQVPSEDWGGGYGSGGVTDSGGEIPCRRMRSGSYIKAMGDDDSADSDTSPKASPKSTLIAQRDAFRRSISMDQRSNSTNGLFINVEIQDPWAIPTSARHPLVFNNQEGLSVNRLLPIHLMFL